MLVVNWTPSEWDVNTYSVEYSVDMQHERHFWVAILVSLKDIICEHLCEYICKRISPGRQLSCSMSLRDSLLVIINPQPEITDNESTRYHICSQDSSLLRY